MCKTFDTALKIILELEGGYVNDPDDPGGETKFGISKRAYPGLDIKNLTEAEASDIYFKDYWLEAGCAEMVCIGVKQALVILHFDAAVNMGVKQAVRVLQLVLRKLALAPERGKPALDGTWGPETSEMLVFALSSWGWARVEYEYFFERLRYYQHAAGRKHYLGGWISRLLALRDYINT